MSTMLKESPTEAIKRAIKAANEYLARHEGEPEPAHKEFLDEHPIPPNRFPKVKDIALPHPDKDPALDPAVRERTVRLADAYYNGGEKALRELYDEMYPPAEDEKAATVPPPRTRRYAD